MKNPVHPGNRVNPVVYQRRVQRPLSSKRREPAEADWLSARAGSRFRASPCSSSPFAYYLSSGGLSLTSHPPNQPLVVSAFARGTAELSS